MEHLEEYKRKTLDVSTIIDILKPYGSISTNLTSPCVGSFKTGWIEILTDEIPTPLRKTTFFKTDIVFTIGNRKWYVFVFCKS